MTYFPTRTLATVYMHVNAIEGTIVHVAYGQFAVIDDDWVMHSFPPNESFPPNDSFG